ncbi:hypothetical protein Q3G72_014511 [Acer saccharum]|nr:hypothetical protein Q3G72_014511 [Acer saccharum]
MAWLKRERACDLLKSSPGLLNKRIDIVNDSKVVVNWIKKVNNGSINHAHSIRDIRRCLDLYVQISIVYCARDFNVVADQLAKKGARTSRDVLSWDVG